MRIPKFEYFRPLSIEEGCSLLYKHKAEAKILAGGTDLFVKMKKKQILPKVVISLNGIQKLNRIEWDDREGLKIGPLVTHEALVNHPIVKEKFDFLSEACFKIGTRQVRNMGTLVGNLCNASPSSDASAPLLVLETKLRLVHLYGERTIPLQEFFIGPFQTALDPQEIVVEVQIPKPAPYTSGSYQYLHKASCVGETLAGAAVFLNMDPKGSTCREARIGLSSVSSTPIRARAAERILKGKRLEEKIIREAAQVASDETQPRSRPWYRREMSRVLVERAVLQAMEKIR
jgi:aerobic carbon-monoxide dehydrogenase medium subunit